MDLMDHGAEVDGLWRLVRGGTLARIGSIRVVAQHAHHSLVAIVAVHAQARVALIAVVDGNYGAPWGHRRSVNAEADYFVGAGVPHRDGLLCAGQQRLVAIAFDADRECPRGSRWNRRLKRIVIR